METENYIDSAVVPGIISQAFGIPDSPDKLLKRRDKLLQELKELEEKLKDNENEFLIKTQLQKLIKN